jgi:pimeloyl-ACP methyl ester carboxylesterase
MPDATLPQGTLRYREAGSGEPIVFLHGYLQDGRLWDPLVERLCDEFRCITPDLPLGAHRIPLDDDADLTVPGVAQLVADFLAALDLHGVTLVGNDTGGGLAQIVAARHAERLGRLVLTNCDAFDNFPPAMFRALIPAAKAHALSTVFAPLKARLPRELPNAYGWLTNHPVPHELIDDWVGAYFGDKGVRHDTRKFTVSLDQGHLMFDIADELAHFTKPALLAWGGDDKIFPYEHAERLGRCLPDARVERIENSRTWVMVDQPERTADLIRGFVRENPAADRTSGVVW